MFATLIRTKPESVERVAPALEPVVVLRQYAEGRSYTDEIDDAGANVDELDVTADQPAATVVVDDAVTEG